MTDDEFVREFQRRAAQRGRYGGRIDGDPGPMTVAALDVLVPADKPTPPPRPDPIPGPAIGPVRPAPAAWPHRDRLEAFFGPAGGPDCTAGSVRLPFPFPLAWDASQRISRFACHKLVAAPLTRIFTAAAAHYGEDQFRLMRLDQFGGCYEFRNTRGGSRLSTHAWGIAVDVDPLRNGLTWGRDKATLDGPEYDPWWRIVEAEGAYSLGRKQNRDWMHFEFASR